MVGQIVVIDSAAVNTFLTTMFLRHISNRACKTVVYSCLLGQYNLPHVDQVHEVGGLPRVNVQVTVSLLLQVRSFNCETVFNNLQRISSGRHSVTRTVYKTDIFPSKVCCT